MRMNTKNMLKQIKNISMMNTIIQGMTMNIRTVVYSEEKQN